MISAIETPLVPAQIATGPPPGRWFGVGHSTLPDPARAAREACEQALAGRRAALAVVFCSDAYPLPELLTALSSEISGAPMIGCSTAGEIASDGPGDGGLVVAALGGDGFRIATAAAAHVSGRLREAGATVAACVKGLPKGLNRALLLLTDGLGGDQQEVVRGAYSVVGASVPLVGGCAGDDLKMKRTFQFHNGRLLRNAVVGAAIASEGPIGIGVRHGWRKLGQPMIVSRSAGNRVHVLDDKPALDVYLERLEAPASARRNPAAFTQFAITHPLGLSRRSSEEVRFIGEANFQDRSLGCIANVPQGGLAWFMEGDEQSVLEATDAACLDALQGLAGRPPLGVFAFDCIGRRGILGSPGIEQEVERIGRHVQHAPVAGFYTYGEIARTHGVSGFHNQTLVVLALS